MSIDTKPQTLNNENLKSKEQIGVQQTPEKRGDIAKARKDIAWRKLNLEPYGQKIGKQLVDLLDKMSGKLQKPQISKQEGNNEITPTTSFDQITKKEPSKETQNPQIENPQIENPQVEAPKPSESLEIQSEPKIPLREPTAQELALIRLKYKKLPSKRPEVSKHLNGINDSGTLRKTGEIGYGGIGVETKKRTLLAGKIKEIRAKTREVKQAQESNLIIHTEYQKLADRYVELEVKYKDIQNRRNELNRLQGEGLSGKLSQLKNKTKIDKLEVDIAKLGNLDQIQQEMKYNESIRGQMSYQTTQNYEIIDENKDLENPKELLEGYYEGKLDEFQKYQKQLLERENKKPIPIEEVVKEHNVFFMHGINEIDVGGNTALHNNDFEIRLKTAMLNPALSSFSYGDNVKSHQMWADCQVVFGRETEIFDASSSDLSTKARSFRERSPIVSNYEKSVKEKTDLAIKKRSSNHNEFIVVGEPVGFNIDIDQFQQLGFSYMLYARKTEPKILAAQKLGLPLLVSKGGKIYKAEYKKIADVLESKKSDFMGQKTIESYLECFIIGEEVKPIDIMKMKSPITREKQIKIAQELTEKGVFPKDKLPQEFFDLNF